MILGLSRVFIKQRSHRWGNISDETLTKLNSRCVGNSPSSAADATHGVRPTMLFAYKVAISVLTCSMLSRRGRGSMNYPNVVLFAENTKHGCMNTHFCSLF